MLRALALATLLFAIQGAAASQPPGVLHITVVLIDGAQKPAPVPQHALLVSDNPASAAPRRIVTTLDGTVDVRLRPGNYTVESDRPVVFAGRAYQWTQSVDIAAGRDTVLQLTMGNAEVGPITAETAATAATDTATAPPPSDPSILLRQWHDSVVAIWSATNHASGFVVDAQGLVVTNQRAIGAATAVEVQLAPSVKVAATVLVADRVNDVAILRIDAQAIAAVRPVPLGCALTTRPSLVNGQELFTIGTPLRDRKGTTSGPVTREDPGATLADLMMARGSTGGPVFAADGTFVGLTSTLDENDDSRRGDARVVRVNDVCSVLAAAAKKVADAAAPGGTHLPVEPVRPFPVDALKGAPQRPGSLNLYQTSSSDFDIAFLTPALIYGAQHQSEETGGRDRNRAPHRADADQALIRPLLDFSNWSDYVADTPPVLLVRVTPRFVEGFWKMIARGAAQTQGVSLPPFKRFKSGFARLRAFCGDAEITPIHPFKLEQRITEGEAIYEGLYAFDPGALGPHCPAVKLVLFSEKEPTKGDTEVIDPKIVTRIWEDFAPYRQ